MSLFTRAAGSDVSHADLETEARARGWTIALISDRIRRLNRRGSVLFVGGGPVSAAEALERLVALDEPRRRQRP
jgi:hypothetical protein